jgi:MFS family permease
MSDQASAPSKWRDPDWWMYLRLWFGQLVSGAGDSVTELAMPLLAVLVLHATATQVSFVRALETGANLVMILFVGVAVDKWDRRRFMLLSDVSRGVLMLAAPALAFWGVLAVWHLYIIAALLSVFMVVFDTAQTAYLPLVAKQHLDNAIVWQQVTSRATNAGGPLVGGFVIQIVGPLVAFMLDAGTFVVSAVSIVFLRPTPLEIEEPETRKEEEGLWKKLKAGFKFVNDNPIMRRSLRFVAHANAVLAGQYAIVLVFLVRDVGLNAFWIGGLVTITESGALFGSMFARKLTRRFRHGKVVVIALWMGALFNLLVPLTHSGYGVLYFAIGGFFATAGPAVSSFVTVSYRQRVTRDKMRGRVAATMGLFGRGSRPIGALMGGGLAAIFGLRGGMWALAFILLLSPLWMATSRAVWQLTLPKIGE